MTRKRKKKPSHSSQDPTKVLLISYWPLLDYSQAGYGPGQVKHLTSQDAKDTLIAALTPAEDVENHATACLWCQWPARQADRPEGWPDLDIADGAFFPVLILPRGPEIATHLRAWSEGEPEDWFDLIIDDAYDAGDTRYCAVLMPRPGRSIDRWRLGYRLTHDHDVPDDWTYEIVFRPLAFGAAQSPTYAHIRHRLAPVGGRLPVGILDESVFLTHAADPRTLPQEQVEILGAFSRGDPAPARAWLDPFLADLTCPPPGSPLGGKGWINPNVKPENN